MLPALRLARKRLPAHLISLITLVAVLLPTFGPWLDTDFAGWMPQHDHIYVGEINLDHHSASEDSPKHNWHEEKRSEPAFPFITGIVNLPDQDVTLQSLVLLVYPASPLLQRIDTIWFALCETCYTVCGIAIPPLDKPPCF
ncbi:MAG: hypothetical protein Fur0021_05330 [Candidatus Promineifilaceae bacterium]